jgi:hypothetical protein
MIAGSITTKFVVAVLKAIILVITSVSAAVHWKCASPLPIDKPHSMNRYASRAPLKIQVIKDESPEIPANKIERGEPKFV